MENSQTIYGTWTPGGGCFNWINWRQNPQFTLSISPHGSDSTQTCSIHIELARPQVQKPTNIGLYILPKIQESDECLWDISDVVLSGKLQKVSFSGKSIIKGDFLLDPGQYVIIPSTYLPLDSSLNFRLSFSSSTCFFDIKPLLSYKSITQSSGTWVDPSSVSEKRPYFILSCAFSAHLKIILSADDKHRISQPLMEIWHQNIKCNCTYFRKNGEIFTELTLLPNTLYYITVASGDAQLLGNFQILILSDHDIHFPIRRLDHVPSMLHVDMEQLLSQKSSQTNKTNQINIESITNKYIASEKSSITDSYGSVSSVSSVSEHNTSTDNIFRRVHTHSTQFKGASGSGSDDELDHQQQDDNHDRDELDSIQSSEWDIHESSAQPLMKGGIAFAIMANKDIAKSPFSPASTPTKTSTPTTKASTPTTKPSTPSIIAPPSATTPVTPRTKPIHQNAAISSPSSIEAANSPHDKSFPVPSNMPSDASKTIIETRLCGEWKGYTAAGNARYPFWRQNNQYIIDVLSPAVLTFKMSQLGYEPPVSVGLYVLKPSSGEILRRVLIEDEEHKSTPFADDPVYIRQLSLEAGKYVIIPCTEFPGTERQWMLSAESSVSGGLQITSLEDTWIKYCESGEWNEQTAGGCWTEATWLDNPQYQLKFKKTCQVTIVLVTKAKSAVPIGFYVVKNNTSFKKILEVTPDTLVFPVQFRQRFDVSKQMHGQEGEVFNLIPSTFTPKSFSKYDIVVYCTEKDSVELIDVQPYLTQFSMASTWEAKTPGGSFDYSTWRYNKQINCQVKSSTQVQVGIVLYQRLPESNNQSLLGSEAPIAHQGISYSSESLSEDVFEPIGFYTFKADDTSYKRVLVPKNALLCAPVLDNVRQLSSIVKLSMTPSVSDSSSSSPNRASFSVCPFTVNQYVARTIHYEVRIILQSERRNAVKGKIKVLTTGRPCFNWRGEWADPIAELTSESLILPSIGEPQTMLEKLSRSEIRRFYVQEPSTRIVVLLLQKNFCLGGIYLYKLGSNTQQSLTSSNESEPKKLLGKKDEDAQAVINGGTLIAQSQVSRAYENSLDHTIAGPGTYAVCGAPETFESTGPLLLVLHYWKPLKDLNIVNLTSPESAAKRIKVIEEIVTTEKAYVKNLRVLEAHFLANMLKNHQSLGVQIEDIKKFFSNIPTLLNCNNAFLTQLLATVESNEMAIGKVFSEFCNFFRMYADYTNHFDTNIKLLEELKKKPSFKNGLQQLENDPVVNRLTLNDFYITPVQRIPRYAMLLEQLVKYTEESNPDYHALVSSLERVKNVAYDINEKKRRAESESQVLQIQSTVFFKNSKEHPLIAAPSRLFVRSGALNLVYAGVGDVTSPPLSKKGKTDKRSSKMLQQPGEVPSLDMAYEADYAFLFNDILLLTKVKEKSKEKKYTWKQNLAITSDSDVSAVGGNLLSLRTSVSGATTMTFFFEAPTPAERDMWVSELGALVQVAVNAMHSKIKSKVASWKILDSKMQMLVPS